MLLARKLMLAFDDRIEYEYREIVARPKLAITKERQEAFLAILQFQWHLIAKVWGHPRPPDRDDLPFLEVAGETQDKILVTGNLRHFPKRCRGSVRVLTPRDAWDHLCQLGE